MLDSRIAKKIFGHKREEGRRNWRQWYNEELHYLQFSPNITIISSRRLSYGICIIYGGENKLKLGGGGHERLNRAEGGKIYKEETKVAGNTFRGWPRVEVMKQTDQHKRNN